MPFATLFSDVAMRLFGAPPAHGQAVEPELVQIATEAIVEAVDPRLRAVPSYRRRLAPGVKQTITHLRDLARDLPPGIALSRAAWGADPLVNALFATANDVPTVMSDSDALRAFFDSSAGAGSSEAHALLAMLKTERNVLAPAIVDGVLRQDVAQTTVSFSGHRLVACAGDFAACRREVGTLILRRLAGLALERITAVSDRANALEQHKALLGARLRLLNLKRHGLDEVAGSARGVADEIASIEREIKATVDEYVDAKASLATLETRMAHITSILEAPSDYLSLAHTDLRVNKLGIKVGRDTSEPASNLHLSELSIGAGLTAVVAFVRCRRADLPPKETLSERAARGVL